MLEPTKLPWTEADLNTLIGQSESVRREFKSGRIFDDSQENWWIERLSKEVSALANTEGGDLFLGIDEDKKSKPRVATGIDGVSTSLAPERLQQLIEGNVSPYLPGIRVNRVLLSGCTDRVVFIVQVPQGNTAYQANDGRYYGRSEFEVKHLRDHEVRLRMSRGKVARGAVDVRLLGAVLGVQEEDRKRKQYPEAFQKLDESPAKGGPEVLEIIQATLIPDKIEIQFIFRNDGEITIRAPAVELCELRSQPINEGQVSLPRRLDMKEEVIYPGEERILGKPSYCLQSKRDVSFVAGDYVLHWKVFLDNSPPSSGEIDVGELIETARLAQRH
jgi:hypothetical protein